MNHQTVKKKNNKRSFFMITNKKIYWMNKMINLLKMAKITQTVKNSSVLIIDNRIKCRKYKL